MVRMSMYGVDKRYLMALRLDVQVFPVYVCRSGTRKAFPLTCAFLQEGRVRDAFVVPNVLCPDKVCIFYHVQTVRRLEFVH